MSSVLGKILSKLFLKKILKPNKKPFCSAVIAAAGSGERMGGTDKIFVPLCGEPVILWTIRAFENCDAVQEIVLVVRSEKIPDAAKLCKDAGIKKVSVVVSGGKTRAESVLRGINEVSEKADLVAIHDGARPLVTGEVITTAIEKARTCGAAVPMVPLSDTVKKHKDGYVTHTPDRGEFCCVQTPQVFDYDMIRGVLTSAAENGWELTDDASAVEKSGIAVALTRGSHRNIKITTPEDLLFAEAVLSGRMGI